ncbi:hypothetical protein JCM8202v2_002648 [Rhodotorula sphaerocarpa]
MPAAARTASRRDRQEQEAKTRSRSRHKKCDETRLDAHGGACRRCYVGAWECRWPPRLGERPLKTFVSGVKTASTASPGVEESSQEPATQRGTSVAPAPEESSRKRERFVPRRLGELGTASRSAGEEDRHDRQDARPTRSDQGADPRLKTAAHVEPAPSPSGGLPLPLPGSNDILAPSASAVPLRSHSLVDTGDLSSFFSSLDAEVDYWDSLGGSFGLGGSGTGTPVSSQPISPLEAAHYPLTASGAVAPAAGRTDPSGNPLGSPPASTAAPSPLGLSAFASKSSASAAVAGHAGADLGRAAALAWAAIPETSSGSVGSDLAVAPSVPPGSANDTAAALEDVGPITVDLEYNTFNQGFFRSLPKPVREVVIKRAYNAATSSALSRNASMAMVMLYRLRMQQQQQQRDPEFDPSDLIETTEQQARLLAQSNLYFQRAIEHLQAPIPLEAKMVATLDMQAYQYDRWGAEAANAILLLGEYFIIEALGAQPLLDLSSIRDSANVLLTVVAWSDVIRCVCSPGRRTLFTFSNLPGEPSLDSSASAVVDDVSSQPHDVTAHQGLPVGLLLCLAATVNLASEMDALPDEVVKVKSDGIETAVREWKPPPPDAQDLADSAGYVEKISTFEMWRHAVIVFLYQTVHRHGPLSKVIRDAVQQILQIGSRLLAHHLPRAGAGAGPAVSPALPTACPSHDADHSVAYDEYLSAPATRAVPWFLAGTCAVHTGDRTLCRRGLEACGQQQGYRDNVTALERIWTLVDEKGWAFDWRNRLQEEKLSVGFL